MNQKVNTKDESKAEPEDEPDDESNDESKKEAEGNVFMEEMENDVNRIEVEDIVKDAKFDVRSVCSHIQNTKVRNEARELIYRYNPLKTVDVDVELKLVLKNDVPVNSRPRRLAPQEREVVNKQIVECLRDGIVRPSNTEYTSRVVVVKKKNGSMRGLLKTKSEDSKGSFPDARY